MFSSKPPHDKAQRKTFFGFSTKDISPEDKKLLVQAENALKLFGSSFSDRLDVKKFQGQGLGQVDAYTALRPGCSSDKS